MHYEIVRGRPQSNESETKGTFQLTSERLSDQFRECEVSLVSMELLALFDSCEPLAPYVEVEKNH